MKEKFEFPKPDEEKELNPEQGQELVERLENFPLRIDDKIELLLNWKGEKPANGISIATKTWKENESPKHLDPKRVEEMEKLVKDMGLFSKVEPKQIVDGQYSYTDKNGRLKWEKKEEVMFYVAKTKENLELLMKAIETENDELLGRLYGYPESSIKAYPNEEEIMEVKDLPLEIKEQPSVFFARFKLSKKHWQEELKIGQRWAEIVKETSPKLYNEFIEFMKEVKL